MDVTARRLAALFFLGVLAFCSPFLEAFNHPGKWWGLPLLPLYLFTVWAGLILAAGLIARRRR